jgi:hypothetical protein
MGRKIDKLEKPVGVDYIWGGQKEKKQGLELWESFIGGHYIGLPCNGILIRQFSHHLYYLLFHFRLLEHYSWL